MMTSKKMMKEIPTCDESVILDDHHIGIGLNTVPEPGGFYQYAVFDADDPPETTSATSTAKDSMFEHIDDDVLVRFKPRYVGTTPAISSTGRFDEEMGLIGSKTVKKQLFLDYTVVEPSNGSNTDGFTGHFESKMAAPDVLNDLNAHFCHHSCNHNCVGISFGCPGMKDTPSARDGVRLVDNIGTSEVNCSHNGIGIVKAVPTDGNSNVGDWGIVDLPPDDCARMTETVGMHKGIFENAFADEWTTSKPDPLARTAVIDHVIKLCDFPANSIMVKFINQ
jgi:hypothetical protein